MRLVNNKFCFGSGETLDILRYFVILDPTVLVHGISNGIYVEILKCFEISGIQ